MKSFFVFLTLLSSFSVFADENHLSIELGGVENSFNKVKIPGDDGTRFNLKSSLEQESLYYRLDYKKSLENGHGFRLLYAPLNIKGEHRYSKDISFDGVNFPQGIKSKTSYQFNSYRATYFYQWVKEDRFKLNIGITGKVRDANIKFKQGDRKKNRYDLGFVPLLYVWSEYWLTEKTKLTFDFDGLAAPQGRAFDVALMIGHKFSPFLTGNIGYRMLEGGVDNDKVYNFSQFNFYFASVEILF